MRGRSVRATVGLGVIALGAFVPWALARSAAPKPVLGRTVVVSSVAGKVLVRQKGARAFAPLRIPQAIPVGSTIDASRGTVRLLTSTSTGGATQHGDFDGGAFTVIQRHAPLTDLLLTGGRPVRDVCGAAHRTLASSSSLSPSVLRTLHGHAHGRFRTVGRYAAGTVRGTNWTTTDTCAGTSIASREGIVTTTSGGQDKNLDPGETLQAYCYPPSSQLLLRDYCLFVLSSPALGAFGVGFSTRRNITHYELCIHTPSSTDFCRPFTLMPPNRKGARISAVACDQPGGPGDYTVRFIVGGKQLGPELPFTATIAQPTPTPSCLG